MKNFFIDLFEVICDYFVPFAIICLVFVALFYIVSSSMHSHEKEREASDASEKIIADCYVQNSQGTRTLDQCGCILSSSGKYWVQNPDDFTGNFLSDKLLFKARRCVVDFSDASLKSTNQQ